MGLQRAKNSPETLVDQCWWSLCGILVYVIYWNSSMGQNEGPRNSPNLCGQWFKIKLALQNSGERIIFLNN